MLSSVSVILDPHTKFTRDINARLYRMVHTRQDQILVLPIHRRRFMDTQANAMADPVVKIGTISPGIPPAFSA